jgi:hypothetical protein
VVCVPTTAPVFNKYVKPVLSKLSSYAKTRNNHPARGPQETIGGGDGRSKNGRKIYDSTYVELDEGEYFATAQAASPGADSHEHQGDRFDGIEVRHEINVSNEEQLLREPQYGRFDQGQDVYNHRS